MKNKREIKFRVWNLDRKEWADFGYLDMNGNFIQEGLEYHNYNYKVMQYTGLKDKNGKEIYEGDVVMIQEREDGSAQIGIVKWDTAEVRFFVHVKTSKTDMWYGFDSFNIEEEGVFTDKYDIRIIGNIYENPELKSK